MFGKKRKKNKKNYLKTKVFIFLFLFFSSLGLSFFLFYWLSKSSVVSPIPKYLNISKEFIKKDTNSEKTKKIEEILSKYKISFSDVSYYDNSIFVKLKNGEEIILSPSKDLSFQISSLQLILSRFTIEGKRIDKIDFRFDRPIATFR